MALQGLFIVTRVDVDVKSFLYPLWVLSLLNELSKSAMRGNQLDAVLHAVVKTVFQA